MAPEHAPSAVVTAQAPPTLTAAELFAAANRARIAGDAPLAVRLSRELEDRYPESREAVTTHLSLGLLQLQQGAPADALQEFRRYRAVGSTATMPEALWGESQALRRLGRSAEERAVLEELLDRYPGSAYEAAARRRLADLR
jgi:TolA-binding protein